MEYYYTTRHNAAGRQILHFLKKGGLGRFAILTNFGRVDGDPEQPTVPDWLLGGEGRKRIMERPKGDRGIKPDFVVLKGWKPGDEQDESRKHKRMHSTHENHTDAERNKNVRQV
eukprot:1186634-Prorocentrum_minimum.AAC.1